MFSPMFDILLIPFLVAMFLAINMGGSGTAPSFSAAYGSNLLRKDLIPGLFGVFVFLGAIIAGKKVSLTIGGGILPAQYMNFTLTTIILISISLTLLIANLLGIPQSTSQATVFAIAGPSLYYNVLIKKKLFLEIIPTWFILPIIAFIIMFFVGKFIYNPLKKRDLIPYDELASHPFLKYLVIISSCYVAFAIGSNNVANAAGPIASMIIHELKIPATGNHFLLVMILSTLIIAPCFGIGSSLFGHKIVKTTGTEIIDFGPLGALIISTLTATLLLIASLTKGIPTSLVQINTGAIIALGVSKVGLKNMLISKSVRKFWIIWLISPIISFLISLLLTYTANKLGYL